MWKSLAVLSIGWKWSTPNPVIGPCAPEAFVEVLSKQKTAQGCVLGRAPWAGIFCVAHYYEEAFWILFFPSWDLGSPVISGGYSKRLPRREYQEREQTIVDAQASVGRVGTQEACNK